MREKVPKQEEMSRYVYELSNSNQPMTDLPNLTLTTHSVGFILAQQLCAVCLDTSPELQELANSFDITSQTNSSQYKELLTLLKQYLSDN